MREPGQIKRAPRVDTRFEATLTDSDGSTVAVVVTDISREGCRLETEVEGTLKIGEKVELQVPRYGDFPAQIRWAIGKEAGAVFLMPVSLD
ncbi:MAG TPA: PilZ domain-containing protein [Sphingomicrobium sp.]|nr:PilZ domain-containing protein [Sphingomicrobium sp.]